MSLCFQKLLQSYKDVGQPEWTAANESQVLEPYNYLLWNPGKDIRSTLIHAFNLWLEVPPKSLNVVLEAVEMLHTASLLIDDVEDNSELRRGQQAAHIKFGPASTINAANYIYFSAMSLIRGTGDPDAVRIYEEEILNLHRGQGLELFWRDRCEQYQCSACPTEDEYIAMVNDKTGGLLRMAIRLLQALSPRGPECTDYVPLANMIGILFQIRDDYMNLASTQYCREKGFCEDLTEGKFSFPVIHGIRSESRTSTRLRTILQQKTSDVRLKIEACEILEKSGSLSYTIKTVSDLDALCRQEIKELRGNAALIGILDMLKIDGDGSEIRETIEFAATALAG